MSPLDLRYPFVRFLAAFCHFLPGPIVFPDASSRDTLTHVSVPQARLFLIAMGCFPTLTMEEVEIIVADTRCDAILLRLCQDTTNPFRFDVIMSSDKRTERYIDYRLYLSADRQATLLPRRLGDVVHIGKSGLLPIGGAPYRNAVELMEGLGRGTSALAMFVGSVLVSGDV